jgi:uncharacterized protein YndB with AHSA1/START domain
MPMSSSSATASTDAIEREIHIAAPPRRVWELLTTAEHLGTWFADAGAEIDLRPGGALQLRWTEHGTVHGRVEAVEAPTRFMFRWGSAPGAGAVQAGDGTSTLVEFTLAEADGGTVLRVVESGFSTLAADADERARKLAGNTEGWRLELEELRAHAEAAGA